MSQKPLKELLEFSLINIDKPSGPTSFQVSQYLKNSLNLTKTSHLGTLDPQVTGVLPIALSRACRLSDVFMHKNKTYIGIMRLHKEIPPEELKKAIKKFIGKIIQLPPVRSRVKRQEREREVISFDILEIEGKDILFKTEVQAGTYIRKLCLHPDTEILTRQGIIKLREIIYSPNNVYSLNNKKIVEKRISSLQKISSSQSLLRLKMESGIDIVATPDHKMLVSTKEGYKMVECKNIKENSYLAKALYPQFPNKEFIISDFLDNDYLIEEPQAKKKCKEAFIKKFGSIRKMNRELKFDRKAFLKNSKVSISIKHLKLAGIYDNIKHKLHKFKTSKGRVINMGRLNKDHFYLFGLIASDGNNTKEKKTKRFTRLKFHNENEFLIDTFMNTYKKLFPNVPISKRKIKNNLFQLDTANSLFASVAAGLGIKSPNTMSDILPILYANNQCIKSFLKGYFDGDGTIYHKKKKKLKGTYFEIKLFSKNYINSKRLHQMLLKVGMPNKIFRLRSGMNVVCLSSIPTKKKFIKEIGTNHPIKKIEFEKVNNLNEEGDLDDYYHIGMHYKTFISQKKSKLYGMGGNLTRILNSNAQITKGFYKRCSKLTNLPKLDELIIEKVTKIEKVASPEFVFDLTIPKTHNFLIETGFISSNCDDIGKELGIGSHMLELRRTQAGIFSEEKIYTLYDLDNAIEELKKHNEEPLRKMLVPAEEAINKVLPAIQANPEQIKKLLTGKPLMKQDILSDLSEQETFALFNKEQFIGIYKKTNEGDIIARPLFVFNYSQGH